MDDACVPMRKAAAAIILRQLKKKIVAVRFMADHVIADRISQVPKRLSLDFLL